MLEQLTAHKIPIGVVSNKTKSLLVTEIDHFGFTNLFGSIIGAGDAVRDKPDAAPIVLALEQLDIEPSRRVWMVGDTPVDWDAARAAGVFSIAVGVLSEKMQNKSPHMVFDDLQPIYESLVKFG